ncbi:uncharacterized protein K452DRAFT_201394, partial [Aplosporella prunicola CBS 121167]
MAEYWKSTPKYWCKFCKTYIRDTKFERQQHDATPKHQNNIQRSLRDLHKTKEYEERDRERARAEVARLNGVVPGAASASTTTPASSKPSSAKPPAPAPPRQATAEDRKRQLKQLAEMGVAVPDAYRSEMAMAGDWQTVAVKPIRGGIGDGTAAKPLNIGVRKRKAEGDEDEENDAVGGRDVPARKRGWGNTFKSYPGSKGGADADADIEALLGGAGRVKTEAGAAASETVKADPDAGAGVGADAEAEAPRIKKEEPDDADTNAKLHPPPPSTDAPAAADTAPKTEAETNTPP